MTYTIKTHRKLETGRYFLEIENEDGQVYTFEWPASTDLSSNEYEAQQIAEVRAILEASARKGTKLKSEGTTL